MIEDYVRRLLGRSPTSRQNRVNWSILTKSKQKDMLYGGTFIGSTKAFLELEKENIEEH